MRPRGSLGETTDGQPQKSNGKNQKTSLISFSPQEVTTPTCHAAFGSLSFAPFSILRSGARPTKITGLSILATPKARPQQTHGTGNDVTFTFHGTSDEGCQLDFMTIFVIIDNPGSKGQTWPHSIP